VNVNEGQALAASAVDAAGDGAGPSGALRQRAVALRAAKDMPESSDKSLGCSRALPLRIGSARCTNGRHKFYNSASWVLPPPDLHQLGRAAAIAKLREIPQRDTRSQG